MHLTRTTHLLSALALSAALPCFAQEDLLEKFLQDDEARDEASESWLQELLTAPLDLNRISLAELQRLPFLSSTQIDSFLAQRKSAVYFSNTEEAWEALQVRGDTLAFCREIFTTRPPPVLRTRKSWRAELRSRTGAPATIEPNWRGAKYRIYHRARGEYGALHFGILTERDPGERAWADHRAWHVVWQTPRSRVVLGNFQTEWGLGLAQWGPYVATISSEPHALARRWGRGLVPYLGANENAGYHGAALAHETQQWSAFVFINSSLRDVTLNDEQLAVSYRTSGYHRTTSESAQRDNLRERTHGAGVQYRFGADLEFGAAYYAESYNRAWQAADMRAGYFDFAGARNEVLSMAGAWQGQQQALRFEIARSRSAGKAAAFTLFMQERMLSWSLALFHVDRDFHSPHSRSFTESDASAQGHSGFALGLALQIHSRVRGEFFYQHEKKLWSTDATPLPAYARRLGAELEWIMLNELRFRVRYTFSEREDIASTPAQTLATSSGLDRLRGELEHKLTSRLRLKPRYDFARERKNDLAAATHGAALSLDVLYQISTSVTLNFRETHFDSRLPIYQYERDLPGVFTVAALRERGRRRYIYGRLKWDSRFSLSGKISWGEPEHFAEATRAKVAWGVQFDWVMR